MRFESVHLSQLMNELEGSESTSTHVVDSPMEGAESPRNSEPSPEISETWSPSSNTGEQLQEQHFQELLQQYGLTNSSGDVQNEQHNFVGPIRSYQQRGSTVVHPYERPDSPELDLPQTLLDLQDAAIRLANGQNTH